LEISEFSDDRSSLSASNITILFLNSSLIEIEMCPSTFRS